MSTLTLIRHSQAGEEAPLSAAGEAQARALAEHWLACGESFDEVYTGSLARQKQTEAVAAAVFRERGAAWPEAEVASSWDEYDAPAILERYVPALAARDRKFAQLVSDFENARGTPEQNRRFQQMFEVAIGLWVAADIEGVEPFREFKDRVLTARDALVNRTRNRRIAVFTSGGPIGLMVQQTVRAPDRMFLDIHWRLRNASVTEFLFGGGRISLDLFNSVAHLKREECTFR